MELAMYTLYLINVDIKNAAPYNIHHYDFVCEQLAS